MWKSGSLICKSFHSQVFHNKLLNTLFIFLFNFLFSRSRFRFYSIYLIMCKICDKNISNQKYGKLRNCLFKMKNWIKLFLKKPLCLNKRTSLFGKRAPGLFRRTDGDRIPPNWRLFLTLLVQIKKSVFLTKRLIPGRFIFLKLDLTDKGYQNCLREELWRFSGPQPRSSSGQHFWC